MVFGNINAFHVRDHLFVNIKFINLGVANAKDHPFVNITKKRHIVRSVWGLQYVYIPKKEHIVKPAVAVHYVKVNGVKLMHVNHTSIVPSVMFTCFPMNRLLIITKPKNVPSWIIFSQNSPCIPGHPIEKLPMVARDDAQI